MKLSAGALLAVSLTLFLASMQAQDRPGGPRGKRFAAPLTHVTPADPSIRFAGRWEHSSGAVFAAAWSGCGIEFTIRDAASVDILLKGRAGVAFDVSVDGGASAQTLLTLEENRTVYRLADSLDPASPHRFELRKRTEPLFGSAECSGLELAGGGELAPLSPASARRLEFIGDSITCGYGIEAANEREHFSGATENFNVTYAALAADELKADVHAQAWSGACLSAKIAAKLTWAKCLPSLYPLTLPERAETAWDFASWTPDVVVINLGTNDFSANPAPVRETWAAEYAEFLAAVRAHYPQATIFCATGPMLDTTPLNALRAAVRAAVEIRRTAGDGRLQIVEFPAQDAGRDGLGADYHPSRATHRRMGTQLAASIRANLGW